MKTSKAELGKKRRRSSRLHFATDQSKMSALAKYVLSATAHLTTPGLRKTMKTIMKSAVNAVHKLL
jgi:hypothetical protein